MAKLTRAPMHSRKWGTVDDDNDLAAIDRAYRYLDAENPLWRAGMPGAPSVAELRQQYRAMMGGELVEVSVHARVQTRKAA